MPLSTLFPPAPQTLWRPSDPEIEALLGVLRGDSLVISGQGLGMRGPRIPLDAGLYGVEFQFGPGPKDLPADLVIAEVQVTGGAGSLLLAGQHITAGDLSAAFGGMYQGVRLDLLIEQPIADVSFRVTSVSPHEFEIVGIKLVPRPGRIWFPAEMDRTPDRWSISADRSAVNSEACEIAVRGSTLDAGDHRLGVKLRPPDGVDGDIAEIRVTGHPLGGGDIEVIAADLHVTAQAMRANFGVPDAKLRFRLAGAYRDVSVEVRALIPGLIVQWVRLATADEAVWHHYWNLGGTRSVLGAPAGAFSVVDTAPGRLRGAVRRFERGAIYWTVEHGPCEIHGGILKQYESRGGPSGDLGLPITRPSYPLGEMLQSFEGGAVKTHL